MSYNFQRRRCPHVVDVWTAQPENIPQQWWPELIARLDPAECRRAQTLRNPLDRRAHVLAHALRRIALASALKVPANEITFKLAANGRPVLGMPDCRPLFFSLSHTRELVVCAVTESMAVGVDAEPLRPKFADLDWLSGYVVMPAANHHAAAFPDSVVYQFYFYWTVLEAYWKAKGLGLSSDHPALVVERAGHAYKVYEDSANSGQNAASAMSVNAPSGLMISMVLDLPPDVLLDAGMNLRHHNLDEISWRDGALGSHVSPERMLTC